MKIADIVSSIKDAKTRVYTAYRIHKCCSTIKKAIVELKEDGELPHITMTIISPDKDVSIEISSTELKDTYGMSDLQALFFMDDLYAANKKEDKADLRDLLLVLTNIHNFSCFKITDEMETKIREVHPNLWKEYQKLVAKEKVEYEELVRKYDDIKDSEL